MANANSSSRLLTFANIQIAAEAFLQGLPAPGTDEHRTKLGIKGVSDNIFRQRLTMPHCPRTDSA